MKYLLVMLVGAMLLGLVGCDRAPSTLGPEYHKGRCAVCKRTTKVQDLIYNPMSRYAVPVCWREDCQRRYAANSAQYVDKAAMEKAQHAWEERMGPNGIRTPVVPGKAPGAATPPAGR